MMRAARIAWLARVLSLACVLLPAAASAQDAQDAITASTGTRSGLEIYARFRDGLADPDCPVDSSSERWRRHFAKAPQRLGESDDDTLALFGYVVDALREADLPTEYALIPFVESGYKPGARSAGGPAGLEAARRLRRGAAAASLLSDASSGVLSGSLSSMRACLPSRSRAPRSVPAAIPPPGRCRSGARAPHGSCCLARRSRARGTAKSLLVSASPDPGGSRYVGDASTTVLRGTARHRRDHDLGRIARRHLRGAGVVAAPGRERAAILVVTYVVVIFSILAQGLTLKRVVHRLVGC